MHFYHYNIQFYGKIKNEKYELPKFSKKESEERLTPMALHHHHVFEILSPQKIPFQEDLGFALQIASAADSSTKFRN